MKRILLIILLCQLAIGGFAQQNPDRKMQGKGGFKMPQIGRLYGTIIDAKTNKAVEFASVALFSIVKDSAVAGDLAKGNGDFSLDNLPFGSFKLKVSFIGYKSKEIKVSITPQTVEQDLGNISIDPEFVETKSVEITGEKSTMVMSIDRKVYNVDKDISVRGGTALDVMRNIPSVTVDNDGNASLRNNSTQIYIDGKPTSMTLLQIPADQIEKVEIITNASAKFEASATGGILNIVMKKNLKPGYNGVISAGAGTNNRLNGNILFNLKKNRVNPSMMYGYNQSYNYNNGYTHRTNLNHRTVTNYFNQENQTTMGNMMHNARIGLDYQLTNRSTISISEMVMRGINITNDSQEFNTKSPALNTLISGDRLMGGKGNMYNSTSQISYKRTFPQKGKEFSADVNYNYSGGDNNTDYSTKNYDIYGGLLPANPELQNQNGFSKNHNISFQSDYTLPKNDTTKIETGIRLNYKKSESLFNATNYDYTESKYMRDTFLSNHYMITDMVNAAYITYTSMIKKYAIGYHGGLRFEQSYYMGEVVDKGQTFSYNYPSTLQTIPKALFPSIYFSKKVKETHEFQLNFSRKINRPNFFQLMPFVMHSDKFNYRIGNPKLSPEFTNLSEFNYNKTLPKGNYLASLYFRYTEAPITMVVTVVPGNEGILRNTHENGKNSFIFGSDHAFKYQFSPKWDVMASINPYYLIINSTASQGNLSNAGFSFNSKLMTIYKLPLGINLQVNGEYEAPKVIPQGYIKARYSMDVSLAKDFFGIGSVNLSVNDVFNTRRMWVQYDTEAYQQEISRRRESRYIKFGFNYRFGKMDASFMKKRSSKQNQMQNNGGGDSDF
ncbi:MAG: outer membrane beta-barrel family protein [Bacteroidetes bacterium]|nr:outer membrane beta-barrel family protein [Bacteroidota bacterium]